MTNRNDNVDYFEIFNLSRQDSRKANHDKLKKMTTELGERRGAKADGLKLLHSDAMATFGEEAPYKAYLKKLNAWKRPTDNKTEAELEKERQRAAREAQARREAEAEAEAAKRRAEKAQAEAEEAKRQTAQAEQRTRETQQKAAPPLKTDWHKLGDALKGQLNLPEDGVRATALDLLANRLSNKQTQASQPSVNQQAAINHVSLHGIWREPEGYVWTFEQQGNQLSVQAKSPYPLMATVVRASSAGTLMATVIGISMTGTVSSRQVQLSGFVDFPGNRVHAQATFTLSTDELRLEGAFFGNGKTVPLTLYR